MEVFKMLRLVIPQNLSQTIPRSLTGYIYTHTFTYVYIMTGLIFSMRLVQILITFSLPRLLPLALMRCHFL